MNQINNHSNCIELDDEQLEKIIGGANVGDTVRFKSSTINYCSGCGALLMNYTAELTGIRGELDGHTVYWIKRKCCGYKTSEILTAIVEVL